MARTPRDVLVRSGELLVLAIVSLPFALLLATGGLALLALLIWG
jgi:hypothetical protein